MLSFHYRDVPRPEQICSSNYIIQLLITQLCQHASNLNNIVQKSIEEYSEGDAILCGIIKVIEQEICTDKVKKKNWKP